jgi:hypothetical protein
LYSELSTVNTQKSEFTFVNSLFCVFTVESSEYNPGPSERSFEAGSVAFHLPGKGISIPRFRASNRLNIDLRPKNTRIRRIDQ